MQQGHILRGKVDRDTLKIIAGDISLATQGYFKLTENKNISARQILGIIDSKSLCKTSNQFSRYDNTHIIPPPGVEPQLLTPTEPSIGKHSPETTVFSSMRVVDVIEIYK